MALRSLFHHKRPTLVLVGIGILVVLLAGIGWATGGQVGAVDSPSKSPVDGNGSTPKKLDLNRASIEELARLPGVTMDVAERIVRHRPYKKLDDLVTRRVLGKKEFARIREQVVVGRTER